MRKFCYKRKKHPKYRICRKKRPQFPIRYNIILKNTYDAALTPILWAPLALYKATFILNYVKEYKGI
jgi:hypothetical protein